MPFCKPLLVAAALVAAASTDTAAAADDAQEQFEQKIRPVLLTQCVRCHGAEKTSSGLRVDSREKLLAGGDNGPAVVPGKPDESLLLAALRGTGELKRMPPDAPLPADAVADFEAWIRAGAVWPDTLATRNAFAAQQHWAFRPVADVAPPDLENAWSDHPIDRFLEAEWRRHGLIPAGEAEPRTLIRRLAFDLTGLPPDPDEVARFVRDCAESSVDAAFSREIDRRLESPRYGERWGRHWMDVVRYADTAGDNADYPIPEIVQYRDYIIDAFNSDKPFDLFIREQLAGDLLPDPDSDATTVERIRATGFLALSRRYATGPYELWHLTLEDTIDTVGKAFLGMTLKCARCHDHKFDPVTTADYYALYGIFDSTQFPWAGAEEFQSMNKPRLNFVPLLPREQARQVLERHAVVLAEWNAKAAELEKTLPMLPETEQAACRQQIEELRRRHRLAHRRGYPDDVEAAYAVTEGTPHDVPIQRAGDPSQPGAVVPRGAIGFLTREPLAIPQGASGRKELADWIASPQNPLTARVIANRVWQHHFGRGIVATPSNFGTSGALPTHPELLDYLARRLVEQGWSLKSLHRLILTSRAYRLSSATLPESAAIDTGNAFLWRQNRRRLEAEAIRDALLLVAGRLDLSRPGPHPFPPFERWNWTQHNQFKEQYDSNHRSVYLMTQRLQRHPFLALFDAPDTNTTTDVRTSATVPTQALYLLNSPEMASLAAAFAERMLAERPGDRDRIRLAYEICYSTPPTPEEIERGAAYLTEVRRRLDDGGGAPPLEENLRRERLAWQSYARALLISNGFFYVD